MNLGIIIDWKNENDWARANKLGLETVEFCYNIGQDPHIICEKTDFIKEMCEKYSLRVGSVGRWGTDKFDAENVLIEEELQNNYMLIDFCAEVGCPVFNTGVNEVNGNDEKKNVENAILFLTKCVEYGKQKGVKIATYNCHWNNFVREPHAWRLVHSQIPELGIKYDCSHCINDGTGDYLGEIAEWGDRFYHFHVKGTLNFNHNHVDDPPAGLDMVNWRAVMGLLYAKHYDAMLSIEPHSGTWRDGLGEWGVQYTVNYIRPMIYKGE